METSIFATGMKGLLQFSSSKHKADGSHDLNDGDWRVITITESAIDGRSGGAVELYIRDRDIPKYRVALGKVLVD